MLTISCGTDMSSTAFIEPLPVIDFVTQLLNRDVSSRPLSDADRVKVIFLHFLLVANYNLPIKYALCYPFFYYLSFLLENQLISNIYYQEMSTLLFVSADKKVCYGIICACFLLF